MKPNHIQLYTALNSEEVQHADMQWVHLLPNGTFSGSDGRGPYIADDLNAIIHNSLALARGKEIPIDYDHGIDLAPKRGMPAPAAGWISELEARADGIWGLVKWTEAGARAVRSREYRFLSPAISSNAKGVVHSILRAALTNDPNLNLVSLNSKSETQTMDFETFLAELRKLLGIEDENADAEAVLEKLQTSLNSVDRSKYVPVSLLQAANDELRRLKRGVTLHAATRTVEQAIDEGFIMPFMRDWSIELCMTDPTAFDNFIGGPGKPVKDFTEELFSRTDFSHQLELDRTGQRGIVDDNIAKRLGLSDDDIKAHAPRT